jgi:hypothetical protein
VKKRIAVGASAVGWLLVAALGSTVAAQYPPAPTTTESSTTTTAPTDASASTTTAAPTTTVAAGDETSTTTTEPADDAGSTTTAPPTTTASITLTIENAVVTFEFPDDVPEEFKEDVDVVLSDEAGTLKVTITVPCVVPGPVTITFNGQTKEADCESVTLDGRVGTSGVLLAPSLDGVGNVRFQTPSFDFNGLATATFDAPTVAGDYVVTVVDLASGFETAFTLNFAAGTPGSTASGSGLDVGTVLPVAIGLVVVAALMFVVVRRRGETESLT